MSDTVASGSAASPATFINCADHRLYSTIRHAKVVSHNATGRHDATEPAADGGSRRFAGIGVQVRVTAKEVSKSALMPAYELVKPAIP